MGFFFFASRRMAVAKFGASMSKVPTRGSSNDRLFFETNILSLNFGSATSGNTLVTKYCSSVSLSLKARANKLKNWPRINSQHFSAGFLLLSPL